LGSGFVFGGVFGFVFGVFVPLLHEDVCEGLFFASGLEFGYGGERAVDFVFDHIFYRFSELRGWFGEVGGGDLEAVEEQAGALGVDVVGGDAAQDFADGELDGGAVFGLGHVEGGLFAAAEL